MNQAEIRRVLQTFFPGAFMEGSSFLKNPDGERIATRLLRMNKDPIHVTAFNQLLTLVHEAGVTPGFFKYYFQSLPLSHPYPVDKVLDSLPVLDNKGISSLRQLEWGFKRVFIDALLYWGDIRFCYQELRRLYT